MSKRDQKMHKKHSTFISCLITLLSPGLSSARPSIVFTKIFAQSGSIRRTLSLLVIAITALILVPFPASGAITYVGTATTGIEEDDTDKVTFSYTVPTGSYRILIVLAVADEDSSCDPVAPATVTYGGLALTKLDEATNSTKEHASLWYRVAPIEGAANVIADWVCSGGDYGAAAYSYTGVHQTTPFGTPNSNTGNSGTASVIVDSATGELVIDGMLYNFNDATPLPVKDGTQTQRVLAEIPELDADTTWVRSGASEKAGAASVTMSWTASSGNEWAIVGAALKPVATCPGGSVCWDGGGSTNNWSEAANWTGDAVPGSAALVVFNGLSTKDATFNVADTIGSLTLASGYTDTLTLSATLTNDGPFIMNSGTLNMGSATVNQNDDWTYTAGTVDAGTSNVILASSDLSVNSVWVVVTRLPLPARWMSMGT
jgi:hypothetical protein